MGVAVVLVVVVVAVGGRWYRCRHADVGRLLLLLVGLAFEFAEGVFAEHVGAASLLSGGAAGRGRGELGGAVVGWLRGGRGWGFGVVSGCDGEDL